MKQNIECPTCGADMERRSHPDRWICPYCEKVVYPEKKEVIYTPPQAQSTPPPQHIYVHVSVPAVKEVEPEEETPWWKEEVEDDSNNGGENDGCSVILILILGLVIIFTVIALA